MNRERVDRSRNTVGRINKYLLISCFVFVIVAVAMFFKTRIFLENAVKTDDRIIEIASKASPSPNSTSYFPVAEYTLPEGIVVRIKSSMVANSDSYKKDDNISVYYDPAQPHVFRINKFSRIWFETIVCCVLGGLALLAIPFNLFILKFGRMLR
ncbi:MAG: DUF3592 domain-containing protein [Lentisphaerae bacterium]|nr:DUF3592 domain-containing protein [Lentisphaerota bacterium]MCP4102415.1 DUF3592 domain-containing protein [Lentisphaerota bacterium]